MLQVSNVRHSRVGSNDAEFYDDPEDPDYVEEPVEEFEGKSYCPLLDHVEPRFFANIKYDQLLMNFCMMCLLECFSPH